MERKKTNLPVPEKDVQSIKAHAELESATRPELSVHVDVSTAGSPKGMTREELSACIEPSGVKIPVEQTVAINTIKCNKKRDSFESPDAQRPKALDLIALERTLEYMRLFNPACFWLTPEGI
jgi:hypothetical protein